MELFHRFDDPITIDLTITIKITITIYTNDSIQFRLCRIDIGIMHAIFPCSSAAPASEEWKCPRENSFLCHALQPPLPRQNPLPRILPSTPSLRSPRNRSSSSFLYSALPHLRHSPIHLNPRGTHLLLRKSCSGQRAGEVEKLRPSDIRSHEAKRRRGRSPLQIPDLAVILGESRSAEGIRAPSRCLRGRHCRREWGSEIGHCRGWRRRRGGLVVGDGCEEREAGLWDAGGVCEGSGVLDR